MFVIKLEQSILFNNSIEIEKSSHEWTYFLRGAPGMDVKRPPKPELSWLKLATWHNIYDMSQNLPKFSTLAQDIQTRPISVRLNANDSPGSTDFVVHLNPRDTTARDKETTDDVDNDDDEQSQGADAAFEYTANLTDFDKLMLIKCFAEDKVVQAVTLFVAQNLGQSFVESPPTDLNTLYKDMSNKIPLVFILSTGSDPMGAFLRFAKEQGFFLFHSFIHSFTHFFVVYDSDLKFKACPKRSSRSRWVKVKVRSPRN